MTDETSLSEIGREFEQWCREGMATYEAKWNEIGVILPYWERVDRLLTIMKSVEEAAAVLALMRGNWDILRDLSQLRRLVSKIDAAIVLLTCAEEKLSLKPDETRS